MLKKVKSEHVLLVLAALGVVIFTESLRFRKKYYKRFYDCVTSYLFTLS